MADSQPKQGIWACPERGNAGVGPADVLAEAVWVYRICVMNGYFTGGQVSAVFMERAELALARKKAEADVRSHGGVPEDCEFVLEAWAAMDL